MANESTDTYRYYLVTVTEDELTVVQIAANPLMVQSVWPKPLTRKLGKTMQEWSRTMGWLFGLMHFTPPAALKSIWKKDEN